MSAEIIHQPGPDVLALLGKREQLATVRTRLAEQEADLAQLRAQLKAFVGRYLREVGVLYAELDELEAKILERQASLEGSDAARQQAQEARQRAQQSHEAAFRGDADEVEVFDPSPDLKALFRELAKRIHPDFARDAAETNYLHMLMSRANQAYSRGDTHTLQRLLDDHRELHEAIAGESTAAESLRVTRQIRHGERELARLEAEHQALLGSEIAQLFADAEDASREHRDLLTELASKVRTEIADAHLRFSRVTAPVNENVSAFSIGVA